MTTFNIGDREINFSFIQPKFDFTVDSNKIEFVSSYGISPEAIMKISQDAGNLSILGSDEGVYTPSDHAHDDKYYRKTEVNDLLDDKSDIDHTHDDRYYTETEVDNLLDDKSNIDHTHSIDDLSNTSITTPTSGELLIYDGSVWKNDDYIGKSTSTTVETSAFNGILDTNDNTVQKALDTIDDHVHDDRYYTENETNNLLDDKVSKDKTGLYKITENSKTGWRLYGFNPDNYSDIGDNAVDLSISNETSVHNGAHGDYSFSCGLNTQSSNYSFSSGYKTNAFGTATHSEGYNVIVYGSFSHGEGRDVTVDGSYSFGAGHGINVINESMFCAGSYNNGISHDTIFEYGIGTSDNDRKNAFEIYNDGTATLPESTITTIKSRGNKSLITYETLNDEVTNHKISELYTPDDSILVVDTDNSGILNSYTSTTNLGRDVSTHGVSLTLGNYRTDNGYAWIDLVGDTTYTDYGLRVIRYPGENGASQISHKGNGDFILNNSGDGNTYLKINSINRVRVTDNKFYTYCDANYIGENSNGNVYVNIGANRTADGASYIDLIGDTTYTDYGLRVLRSSGENSTSELVHRGTGELKMRIPEGRFAIETGNGYFFKINQSGDLYTYSTNSYINTGKSGSVYFNVGGNRTGDGNTFIDLIGDTTYTDYGLRIGRYSGENAKSSLYHRGEGDLILETESLKSSINFDSLLTKISNKNYEYNRFFDGSTDIEWKKLISVSFTDSTYRASLFRITINDAGSGYGGSHLNSIKDFTYYVSCVYSSSTIGSPDTIYIDGINGDYIQGLKISEGVYEIQYKHPTSYHDINVKIECLSKSGGCTIEYHDGTESASTSGTFYTVEDSTEHIHDYFNYVDVYDDLTIHDEGNLKLNGYSINEISDDETMVDESSTAVVTERAIKTLIDEKYNTLPDMISGFGSIYDANILAKQRKINETTQFIVNVSSSKKVNICSSGDNNIVYHNGDYLTTLDKGEIYHLTNAVNGDYIDSKKGVGIAIDGDGTCDSGVPFGFFDTKFFFYAFRNSDNATPSDKGKIYVICGPVKSTVKLTKNGGSTVVDGPYDLEPYEMKKLYTDANTEFAVEATEKVLVYITARDGRYDQRLCPPLSTEIIGWGRNGYCSALYDNTTVKWYKRDGTSGSFTVSPGSPKSLHSYSSESNYDPEGVMIMKADGPISALSGADADGTNATAWFPLSIGLAKLFPLPSSVNTGQHISIASPYKGYAKYYDSSGDLQHVFELTKNNDADVNAPFADRWLPTGLVGPGGYIISTVPCYVCVDYSGNDDFLNDSNEETILLGTTPKNLDELILENQETLFWNGFDRQDPDTMGEISFDNSTRTFKIENKTGEDFYHFWVDGVKITKKEASSVVIPDTYGTYYIYFDESEELQYILESAITDKMFYNYALVGLVHWNPSVSAGMCGDERHGIRMSGATHEYNHNIYGARYCNGIDIQGLTNGSKTYTQTTAGKFRDEDIIHNVITQTTHPFLYRTGSEGYWVSTTANNEVAYIESGDSYYSWNKWDGSTWSLQEGQWDSDFWIEFFITTPAISGNTVKKIIGQNAYSSRSEARNNIENEIYKMRMDGLPSPEILFLYAVIVKRNGQLQKLADGSLYYDLRKTKGGSGGSSQATGYASDIRTDTTNFDGILDSNDSDVQLALDTIDDHTHDFDDLSDVDLSTDTPSNNDLLKYDGSDWVPTTASVAEGTGQGDYIPTVKVSTSDASGSAPNGTIWLKVSS